jgi:hypothetical protein
MILRFTWLSSPSVISIKKNRIDQNGGAGRLVTASGYTTNANPAPEMINVKPIYKHLLIT